MDFKAVSAEDFEKSLTGIGMNILVRDIHVHTKFPQNIFKMSVHQLSSDFAILYHDGCV
jgi:hypothetical protein